MTKKVFYEKVGNRYVPVSEYDSDWSDSFRKGSHVVVSYPGGTSYRYNIDPEYAPLIAAGKYAEDAICDAIHKASECRPSKRPITIEQKLAWDNLRNAFGDDMYTIHGPSTFDIAKAGVDAMVKEAEKFMTNPAVKNAYEYFLMLCKLTKENECEN